MNEKITIYSNTGCSCIERILARQDCPANTIGALKEVFAEHPAPPIRYPEGYKSADSDIR